MYSQVSGVNARGRGGGAAATGGGGTGSHPLANDADDVEESCGAALRWSGCESREEDREEARGRDGLTSKMTSTGPSPVCLAMPDTGPPSAAVDAVSTFLPRRGPRAEH